MRFPSWIRRKIFGKLAASAAMLLIPMVGQASLYQFEMITLNSPADMGIAGQFAVDVTAGGAPGQASFRFTNSGPTASSISEIYFDDGTLLGIASVTNSLGVNFLQLGSPPDLPGGNNVSPPFETTAGFYATATNPSPSNGVNLGEEVTILFNLINGKSFEDTLTALETGDLRLGLHVQGISPSGESESFINVIPEPGTLILLGSGLLVLVVAGRKKFRK